VIDGLLYSSDSSGLVIVWEINPQQMVRSFTVNTSVTISMTTDGQSLYIGSEDGHIYYWGVPSMLMKAAIQGYFFAFAKF
jgi:WD40 repeat protein